MGTNKGSTSGTQNQNWNSTQTYTPAAYASGDLQGLWNRIQGTSNTPFNPYQNALNAGPTPSQWQTIARTYGVEGTETPYFDQAQNYARLGASGITQSDMDPYMNPYTEDVVNATMRNIDETNAQQQQQVRGNATAAGALGGDRLAVAQSELARQQRLASDQTISGLRNQNFMQAQNAVQNLRGRQGQAAYTFGNLGSQAVNTRLGELQAQLGAAGIPQQMQQQMLNSAWQYAQLQNAYPFQGTQYATSLGYPVLSGYGGTQTGSGTSTGSTSSSSSSGGAGPFLGLLGGLFGADGGRVPGYALGGSTPGDDNPFSLRSYIDVSNLAPPPLSAPPRFSNPPSMGNQQAQPHTQDPMQSMQQMQKFGKGLKSGLGKMFGQQNNPLDTQDIQQGNNTGLNQTGYEDTSRYNDAPGSYDMGNDFGSFDGGFSGGMDSGAETSFDGGGMDFGGYKQGGGVSSGVDSLIQTAHRIKEGLHRMPSRKRHGYATDGAVDDTPDDDPYAYYDKGVKDLLGRGMGVPGLRGGALGTWDQMVGNKPPPYSTLMDKAGVLPYFAGTPFDNPDKPMRQWGMPSSPPNTGAQPLAPSDTMPFDQAPLAPSDEMPIDNTPGQASPYDQRMAPQGQFAPMRSPSFGPSSPAQGRQLGMRPNEIAGFNEATGAYEPRNNLWLNQAQASAPQTSPYPMRSGPSRAPSYNANQRQVMDDTRQILTTAGLSPVGVAGIFGNIGRESNWNPASRHPDQPKWGGEGHFAHGLYQEGGQEWYNYEKWLKANHPGANWQDHKLQTEFLAENLQKNYPKVWERMNNARTPEEASDAFMRGYLKPANWAIASSGPGRAADARRHYEMGDRQPPMTAYERTRQILSGPPILPLDANERKTGLIARMQGPTGYSREADMRARQLLIRAAEHDETSQRENFYPLGTDSNTGHPLLYDRRSGRAIDSVTGQPLGGNEKIIAGGAAGRTPAQLVVANALVAAREEQRKANPSLPALGMEEAIMQAKRAPNDREGLAAVNARADMGYLRDPVATLQKWRKIYMLPPEIGGGPQAPAPQGNQPGPAGAIPLSAADPAWQEKYKVLPSGAEFIFTDKDGTVKRGKKP